MKKITFIIYASVIAITAIFALIFKQYVNVHIESIFPIIIIVSMLCAGRKMHVAKSYYYKGEWHSYSDSIDFKYSKNDKGEGKFNVYKPKAQPEMSNIILAYTMYIGASLNVPLIVFFNYEIKYLSFGIMLICSVVGVVFAWPFAIKEGKKQIEADEARSEQWKRELEEQKKREELGKWK